MIIEVGRGLRLLLTTSQSDFHQIVDDTEADTGKREELKHKSKGFISVLQAMMLAAFSITSFISVFQALDDGDIPW